MQKLTLFKRCLLLNSLGNSLGDSRGSVLVSAVAVSILMAIAGIGFMQVNTSSLNNETAALEREQAFRAAESGVWTGARWLRANYTIANGTYYPFGSGSYYLTINGMDVYTTVTISGPKDTLSVILTAEAYKDRSGSHQKTTGTFCKSLSVNSASAGTYGEYGTFFDGAVSTWPGFFKRTFDGRFHMNRSIMIYSTAKPATASAVVFKNGLVTTGTKTANFHGSYGKGSHDNNNYNYGVELKWTGGTAAECDQILQSHFLSNQDNIALPTGLDITDFAVNPKHYTLPASYDEGEGFDQYRPTMVLGVKNNLAYYRYYYRPSGTPATRTCDSNYLPHGDGTIFIAPNNINIYGTVKGQITVCTNFGKSICPVNNLMYDDYTIATNSVPDGSKSILGLVAGKHFRFNHQWEKDFTGTATQVTPPADVYLNGSMIAVENSGTSWYGTEYWDPAHPVPYNFKLFGNHILNQWTTPTSGANGSQGQLTFSHDLRMIKKVNPPGFPPAKSEGGLWTIALHGWSEKNGSN